MQNTKNTKALLLDMDGVIWKGNQAIGNLPEIFDVIRSKGIQFIFATNNSTLEEKQYINKLMKFGVDIDAGQIITSAMTTANYLENKIQPGIAIYVIGEQGLITALENKGFIITDDTPEAVVVGLDSDFTYKKLKIATLLIRAGKPFYATNPDLTLPSPQGLIPGAGSIIAALEAATDQKAIIIGKPEPIMFNQALQRLNVKAEETLVVGDRLETDIAGGQAAKCRTVLVLTGVATKVSAATSNYPPDIIVQDLAELVHML